MHGCLFRDPHSGSPVVENFSLVDHTGKRFELSEAKKEFAAVVFVAHMVGCPILGKYYRELEGIQQLFQGRALFRFVNPNGQDNQRSVAKELRDFGSSIPALMDPTQRVSRSLGLTRASETVVVETGKMRVVYKGPIDDKQTYMGARASSSTPFLQEALSALLRGRSVPAPSREAFGCAISFHESP